MGSLLPEVMKDEMMTRGRVVAFVRPPVSRRFSYIRPGRASFIHVIVDVDTNGCEEWAEQPVGEVRWHPYAPSDAERLMLLQWLSGESVPVRQPLVSYAVSLG